MSKSTIQSLLQKKAVTSKLFAGAIVAVALALFSVGAAGAVSGKPSKDDCAQNGYTNYGQCVRDWAHQNGNGGGNGYGGNANVDIDVNGNIVGGDLVIIVINYFF